MPNELNAPALADSTSSQTIPENVVTPEQETQDWGNTINEIDRAGGKTEPLQVPSREQADTNAEKAKGKVTVAPAQPAAASAAPTTQPSQADLIRSAIDATASATARAVQAAQPRPAAAPQREMTEAEFNTKYGIPVINEATMVAILDADPKKGAAMMANLFRQQTAAAVRMANDLQESAIRSAIERERAQVQPDIQAWRKYNETRQEESRQNAFYTAHPDLAAEKELVSEILDATQAKVASGKLPAFKSETEVYNFIAAAARKITSRMTPTGGTSSAPAGQQSPQPIGQPAPRPPHQRVMATATSSARGGTGQKPPSSELDEAMAKWDN